MLSNPGDLSSKIKRKRPWPFVVCLVAAAALVACVGLSLTPASAIPRIAVTRPEPEPTPSRTLPDAVIKKASPYVTDTAGHATLSSAASGALAPGELAVVKESIARYNSEVSHVANAFGAGDTSPISPNAATTITGPTCAWSWNYQSHWYGWLISMNACLVDWLQTAANAAAAISALVAAIQAFLDAPANVAAIMAGAAWTASGVLALQLKTCQQLGLNAITWASILGTLTPGC